MSEEPRFPINNDLNPDGPPAPDPEKIKADKARMLIDEIVDEKLKPINTQLAEMPNLIKNTIYSVFNEMQNQAMQQQAAQQPQQQAQPQQGTGINAESLKAIAELAGPLLGKGQSSGDSLDFKSMMAEWGMRMFNYHLDNMAQSVYQIKLPPPADVNQRMAVQKPKPNLVFE